jgi:Rrf2 family protein
MRLTKSTSHAIRILLDCARADDQLVKVAVLSERLDITQQNIFKIVNLLAKAGLIEAVRGRNGGVKLARPASEIRIGDVVRASEVTRVEIEHGAVDRAQGRGRDVNQILDDALGAFIDVLDQHTLADMAKSQRSQPVPAGRKAKAGAKPDLGAPARMRRPLHDNR